VALVFIAFIPFMVVALTNSSSQWQFMGMLNNPRDGATYLSKMMQGEEGDWMVHFQHTPEDHAGAFIQVLYPVLGQMARILRVPSIALFHAARIVASLVMYITLYYLGASIWMRLRTRRIFFLLVAVASGLGWLYLTLTQNTDAPDLTIPEIYPFYSSLVNVHFPLTIACLAVMVSILIVAFRPGAQEDPTVANGGLTVGLLSFALALLYPQSLVPIGGAGALYLIMHWAQTRRLPMREFRWMMVIVLPAAPVAAYYYAITTYNPAFAEWSRQNVTPAPNPLVLIIGLGVPLLMALPGIIRAIRRFEPDGDQFMLLWLIVILVAMYLPTSIQRRFAVGLMIPIIYFATRSLEDFWFRYVNRRRRNLLLLVVAPLITLSYALILVLNLSITTGPFLPRDYAIAFNWIKAHDSTSDVVLASEDVSLWVPGWTGARVVYGHPYETLDAASKRQQVIDWYTGGTTDCQTLLKAYNVRYIIVGPEEAALGKSACISQLNPVYSVGSVDIYAP
jgi:hypothetical protein